MNYSFPTSRVSAFLFLFESRFDLSDLSVDYWITLAGCLIHHTIYPLERQCGFETGLFNKHLVQVAPLARVFYINIIMLSFDMDSGYFILLCCFFLQVVVDEGWARDFLDNATRRIFTSSAVIPAGSTVTFDFLSDSLLYWFVCSPKQKRPRARRVSFSSARHRKKKLQRNIRLIVDSISYEDETRSDFIASGRQPTLLTTPARRFQLDVS